MKTVIRYFGLKGQITKMDEAEILKEYYNNKIDRVEFIRQGGNISYDVDCARQIFLC